MNNSFQLAPLPPPPPLWWLDKSLWLVRVRNDSYAAWGLQAGDLLRFVLRPPQDFVDVALIAINDARGVRYQLGVLDSAVANGLRILTRPGGQWLLIEPSIHTILGCAERAEVEPSQAVHFC